MIPRYGKPPQRGQVYRRRPGVYALLPLGNEVLLTHQAAPTPEFQLPGGGLDPGEVPGRALFREVLEETGWTIAKPRLLGAFRRFTYMPEYDLWAEKICAIYVARPVRAVSAELEDGHVAVWAPLAAASDLLGNSGDRAMVARFVRSMSDPPRSGRRPARNTRKK